MSEPEAIGASLEQLRVECIGMALGQDQLTIAQRLELAAHLVALMEHGASMERHSSGERWPTVTIAPELVNALAPARRETVAEAIKAARDDVMIPEAPAAWCRSAVPGGYRVAALPRWTDERKVLVFRAMAQHAAPWHGVRWALLAKELSDLPGPGITGMQLRDWWIKTGAVQAARGDAPPTGAQLANA